MTRLRRLPLIVRTVLHTFGVRGLARRLTCEAQLRSGILIRRLPVTDGYDHLAPVTWHHRFDLATIRAGYAALPDAAELTDRLRADVARLLAGQQTLYASSRSRPEGRPMGHRPAERHPLAPRPLDGHPRRRAGDRRHPSLSTPWLLERP